MIRNKSWFKPQWINDITVISSIKIMSVFVEKIDITKADVYYNQLKNDKTIICFDFLSENIDDAENTAATNYIRLNSRGKQLEKFENIKAILSSLENKISSNDISGFLFKYDQDYINIFYEECLVDIDLETKTKEINAKSIRFFINTINLLNIINEDKTVFDKDSFYSFIYEEINKIGKSDFWKNYFEFMDIILTAVSNSNVSEYIKEFWNEEYKDNYIVAAYLRYIYYYYKNQGKYINESHLLKFKYILKNLKFNQWKNNIYEKIESLSKYASKYEESFGYFSNKACEEIVQELINHLNWSEINDIKIRIKEQCIKAKVINELKSNSQKYGNIKANYQFFDQIESKSPKRQIQFLLYISNLWNENISEKNISKLLKYINPVKYFYNEK